MADESRLQIRTSADPEKWESVGPGANGVSLPVEIVDYEGNTAVINNGALSVTETSTSLTDGSQVTKIINASTVEINPATEEKQDDIVTAIGNISNAQGDGSQVTQIKETLPVDALNNNASLTISNADTTVTATTVLTKTIGATSYEKTISKNAAGDVVSVSAWSEV